MPSQLFSMSTRKRRSSALRASGFFCIGALDYRPLRIGIKPLRCPRALRRVQRQLHVKDRTVRLTLGERKIASVREHDLLGDRQAEAGPVLLGRLEESEDLDVIGDPGPAVLDGDAQPRGIRDDRRKLDLAGTIADRFESVLDEIVEHAMELAP